MKFSQLVFLLPCKTLEELRLDRSADESEQLLAAWCGLYHPVLLAHTASLPKWETACEPVMESAERLIVAPPCCMNLLPSDWAHAVETGGGVAIRGLKRRDAITAAALRCLDDPSPAVDPDIQADFYALGYCHFLVEMLTRQLRYMSNLDEASYRAATIAAAETALGGDAVATRQRLAEAFRILHQAREYFYPVEAHLLDLTVVASSTLGAPLRAELSRDLPSNLLISGRTVEQLAEREPATLELLKEALAAEKVSVIGGERCEHLLPLLPIEAIRAELERGRAVYEQLLGRAPKVFGRRRFGLTPVLPQVLRSLGFVGAIHSTLDDGQFPTVNQSRVEWVGLDGEGIEAVARVPVDVARPEAFFRLPEKLGSSMDVDYVSTSVFAHWPGQGSIWYDSLMRIASYISASGKFETAEHYFTETGTTGQRKQHAADDYRSPYLRQAIEASQPDPLSRWVRYYARRGRLETAANLDFLATMLGGVKDAELVARRAALKDLFAKADAAALAHTETDETLDSEIAGTVDAATARFPRAIGCRTGAGPRGLLVANPCSFSRNLSLETPNLMELPDIVEPVSAAAEIDGRKRIEVDVPTMGFAWVGPGSGASASPQKKGWLFAGKQRPMPPLAEEHLLRNEWLDVVIDPHGGAIRGIHAGGTRGPRIAQQIGVRLPARGGQAGSEPAYSIMAADEVKVTAAGPLVGEIVSRGRLCDREGRRLAGFRQATRVRRGSRVVEVEIELEPDQPLEGDPWTSYYAARFAWGDDAVQLQRGLNQVIVPTELTQLESPQLIDLSLSKTHTTILTGGLPYHRRDGLRKLDTLLLVQGETARKFRFGIGIDLPNPMAAAVEFCSPPVTVEAATPPASHAWLFHLEAGNVLATHWKPLFAENRVTGMRVRLLETEGRQVRSGLRSFRPVREATRNNYSFATPSQLAVSGDRVTFDIAAYGWIEIDVVFA